MTIPFSEFDGPRLLRANERCASYELSHLCFGGSEPFDGTTPDRYNPPRRGGDFVIAHDGKPVVQIGVYHNQIKLYDATIHTASIGGVCTHPDYRNQGLASYLLDYCTQKLVQEGARLMLISGDLGLYTRLGNVLHGRFHYFSIKPGQSNSFRHEPGDLELRRMTTADIPAVSRLYQSEPVHFIRRYSDFLSPIIEPTRNNYIYADHCFIQRSGEAIAYFYLGCPYEVELEAGLRHVSEYAGSRAALVDALQALITSSNLKEIVWPVPWQDFELTQLLQDCGYSASVAPLDGHTYRIVNFPGFMKDLRPNLQAQLGDKLLRGLRFEQSGPILGGTGTDRYSISRGPDRLELDGAAMTRLVMGSTEEETQPIQLPGALAEVIPVLFPLPSFLPGLNYR